MDNVERLMAGAIATIVVAFIILVIIEAAKQPRLTAGIVAATVVFLVVSFLIGYTADVLPERIENWR